jgi:hypothetical protein
MAVHTWHDTQECGAEVMNGALPQGSATAQTASTESCSNAHPQAATATVVSFVTLWSDAIAQAMATVETYTFKQLQSTTN